jgi:hypothetical protein
LNILSSGTIAPHYSVPSFRSPIATVRIAILDDVVFEVLSFKHHVQVLGKFIGLEIGSKYDLTSPWIPERQHMRCDSTTASKAHVLNIRDAAAQWERRASVGCLEYGIDLRQTREEKGERLERI